MGFKASMIIVNRPVLTLPEEVVLRHLELKDLAFRETTTMENCIYPEDKSVSIGYFSNNLIICEDYLLSSHLEVTNDPAMLAGYEKVLSQLFPDSEILTVACHCSVNYHLYSLVRNGEKIRFKRVVASSPVLEYGQPLEEEESIYADSRMVEGKRVFDNRLKLTAHALTEDQLMEDFAFGVAKRHLGVKISTGEEELLMREVPFKKFIKIPVQTLQPLKKKRLLRDMAGWWKFW